MILDLYIARRFLSSLGVVFAVVFALISLVDLVEQLRKFSAYDLNIWQILRLVLLNIPATLNETLPLLVTIGTMGLMFVLARSSELTILRAIGRSGKRILVPPILLAFVLGVIASTLLNPIVAATTNRYNQLNYYYRTGNNAAVSIGNEGLWLRHGDDTTQSVLHATQYVPGSETLLDATIMTFALDGTPLYRIEAKTARLENNFWQFRNAKHWQLESIGNPEADASLHTHLEFPSSLTQEQFRDSLEQTVGISVYSLARIIRQLRQAGIDSKQYETMLQTEYARPLFLVAMVLCGAALTMGHKRNRRISGAEVITVLLGFALFFIHDFAHILGEHGQIPVALAVWAPPIASLLLGIGLLLHTEEG